MFCLDDSGILGILNLADEVNGIGRDELKVGRCEVKLALYRPRHRPILIA